MLAVGKVRHHRFKPKEHDFTYNVYSFYLDVESINDLANKYKWLSVNKFNIFSIRRNDYIKPHNLSIYDAVIKKLIDNDLDVTNISNIKMLGNIRTMGHCYNPVVFYYCFSGNDLLYVLAEIHNTPWGEKHIYIIKEQKYDNLKKNVLEQCFSKEFHISPFMPLDMKYKWQFKVKNNIILTNMNMYIKDNLQMIVIHKLKLEELTTKSAMIQFVKIPLITIKTLVGIYWQALKLWIKKIPFYSHPRKKSC